MADVGRLAGVTAQTVSRTLAGYPHIKPATRERVLAAVEELGYRTNNTARTLSSGRSGTIGLILTGFGSGARDTVGAAVESAAHAAGYRVSTTTAANSTGDVEAAIDRLANQDVEGLLLAVPLLSASPLSKQLRRRIPTVAIDGAREMADHIIATDQKVIARLAVEHLLSLGHRTVWHLRGPADWFEAVERATGWELALRAAGAPVPEPVPGDWSAASGYRGGQRLLELGDVRAVFAANDNMAIGAIRAFTDAGLRVPEDISVVGVDNVELSAYCTPPLTTIDQPFEQIARAAVAELLTMLSVHPGAAASVLPEPRLVLRSSTAPPQ